MLSRKAPIPIKPLSGKANREAPAQMRALVLLYRHIVINRLPPPSFAELGVMLGVSQTTARQLVARLDRRGYVSRSNTNRYYDIAVTDAGMLKAAELEAAAQKKPSRKAGRSRVEATKVA